MTRFKKSPIGILIFALALMAIAAYFVFDLVDYSEKKWDKANLRVGGKTISVYLAEASLERKRGLSDFGSISNSEGMLFIFDQKQKPGFWMKGMEFSIDIIWISGGLITEISPNLSYDQKTLIKYYPSQDVDRVLEVNAGWAEINDIQIGDHVTQI